ncbi:MAG TPA: hypothetical protein VFW53_09340 [Gallionella sp.]|nr:hypothetical protein [Gallionella sp.]
MNRLLLFLGATHLQAQHMAGGKIVALSEFDDTAEGRENFAAFLQAVTCPAYLLVDLIEEDFHPETVPHLRGRSRTALFKRKFEQFYHGTEFQLATFLQRQQNGRRDDDMLFSALTNPALLAPWLAVMRAQQTPLAGIYSVPQISAPLVEDHPSSHLLLISWEKHAGLRQSYFSGHRLQISRLTPMRDGQPFHAAVVSELARTHQYLKSLSLLPEGQALDVRILCHASDRDELQASLPADSDMHYDLANLAEVGAQLGADYRFTDSDARQIFLHQLAAHRPATSYAQADHTRYFTLWRLRKAFNWISLSVVIASLLWGGANLRQGGMAAAEAESIGLQAQRTLNEAQQFVRDLPKTGAPAADIKSGVVVLHKLDRYAPLPQSVLMPLSLTLDRYPQIRLDELSWRMDAPAADRQPDSGPEQLITIKAHLEQFDSNYRLALAYLDRFQLDLTRQGYRVDMPDKPLDVSPGGSIADRREETLTFTVKISGRPPA